ncbi:MAG: 16S rRNA (adenine(1518)-N(6)/adenine(1519)-N(6))-dimethyltransferase RsmA, partial [Ignavibacterium sp.]|nr:16S rRNA (adenine(1518)-N(6)/adenine(1519)-N(6))-dimethyltransferase RsmA [Ignavibacterium sp.]
MIKPLKKFGQNYLIDKNIIKKIIDIINPQPDDTIIEIGPGKGALTEYLAKYDSKVYAVEIDKRVIGSLENRFPNIEFINQDFLEINLSQFNTDKIRLVGNIPYNITSPILFKIFENNILIKDAVLMVQYEVAKRMTAKVRNKDYGILAVLLQYFSETEICFKVSPNVFYPKPKVFSAVVRINLLKRENSKFNKTFISVVKAAFGNRRKMLKN